MNTTIVIKTCFIFFFHLLLKNLTSQSKCLEKRRFCEFIQKATNRIFSFSHFYEGYIPRYQYRIMSDQGILGWNFSHFGPPWANKTNTDCNKTSELDTFSFQRAHSQNHAHKYCKLTMTKQHAHLNGNFPSTSTIA